MAHPWPHANDQQTVGVATNHGSRHQQPEVHETWVRESGVPRKKRGGRNTGKKRRSRGQGGSFALDTSAQIAEEEEYRADFEAWQMKTYGMIYQ